MKGQRFYAVKGRIAGFDNEVRYDIETAVSVSDEDIWAHHEQKGHNIHMYDGNTRWYPSKKEALEAFAEQLTAALNDVQDELKNVKVTNRNGTEIDFEASVELMDDRLREQLHNELTPCSEQEFFTAYEKLHEETFGEEWELSKENPVW